MKNISLKNLSFSYGKKIILDKININIKPNDVILLIGLNGTGKTTLLKYLIKKYKEISSFMIENAGIYENYTGWQNLQIAKIRYKSSEKNINKYIKLMSLEKIIHKSVSKYSLGEKKRLSICKALLKNADIYIFDEPLNGLDYEGISIFKDIIKELKEENKTIIICSHQLNEFQAIINKCWQIKDKKVYENYLLNNIKYNLNYLCNNILESTQFVGNIEQLNNYINELIRGGCLISSININYDFNKEYL